MVVQLVASFDPFSTHDLGRRVFSSPPLPGNVGSTLPPGVDTGAFVSAGYKTYLRIIFALGN